MGTAKRERQKANRQIRLEELAKQARRDKTRKYSLRGAMVALGIVVIAGGVWLFSGGSSSTPATATSASVSSVAVSTTSVFPTPAKPTVKIPATLPTKLVVTTLKAGTGAKAAKGDTITVHYIGVLSKNGTMFDNSYDRKSPFSFTLGSGQVIQGWDEGLVGTQVGGRYQLDIPAAMAYGATGSGSAIGPNEPLSFVVDVMYISSPATSTTTAGATTTAAGTTTTVAAATTTASPATTTTAAP